MGTGPPVLGVTDPGPTGPPTDGGAGYDWYNPLQELALLVGVDSPVFQYWCQMCGNNTQSILVNLTILCESPAPIYFCFDALSISTYGLCEVFNSWMYSVFYARQCGLTENPSCGEVGG
jgi:hypothetical protein